jgi:hypothetical protein
MPNATSPEVNPEALAALDRALQSPKGIRVFMPTHAQAISFRMRLYNVRRNLKIQNTKIFHAGDPLYGSTPYDKFSFAIEHFDENGRQLREDTSLATNWAVAIRAQSLDDMKVEEL